MMEHGFTIQERPNGIICVTLFNFLPQTVDDYVAMVKQYEAQYAQENRHLRWLIDLRPAHDFNSYALQRSRHIRDDSPQNLRFSLALLLDDSGTSRLLRVVMYSLPAVFQNENIRMFLDENQALEWLDERLAQVDV